jgi:uncharacterized protein
VAVEAASDRRVRALALVAPGLQDPEIVQARYGGPEGVAERIARGEVARWSNRFAVMAWPEWVAFDPIGVASRITAPTLMIHSQQANQPEGARRFFARLAGPKTELWTGGVQFDFYDRDSHVTPAVDAIAQHLGGVLLP